ncbi:MAG: NAD-dependent epimerase [Verrucomicrobiales bacterium]|jgi:UDP-glucuronate 4-epimerase|nr:NAD-dependent epimerase [Verrucomicrobiales bacterium]
MNYLVTGAAGFIGSHVARRLLDAGHQVVGLDNLNDYYDPALKRARLAWLSPSAGFRFEQLDLVDGVNISALFTREKFQRVIHLAAQAGVRYSLQNPRAYTDSNITGFLNILEACRHHPVEHLVFASSSSVYGLNSSVPFSVSAPADHPVSLYAATKKANELMAHAYSHLYRIPATGLRFFTVYGEWGRPDMAPWLFTKAILSGEPIKIFNHGKMRRDFTHINDIVSGVVKIADVIPAADRDFDPAHPNPATSNAPYRLHNIGNNQPVELSRFITAIETALDKPAIREYHPMQPGDVMETAADIDTLASATGFNPTINIEEGMQRFCDWYRDLHPHHL